MKVKLTRDWALSLSRSTILVRALPPPPTPFHCPRARALNATPPPRFSLIRRKGMIEFLALLMESTSFSLSLARAPCPIVCPLSPSRERLTQCYAVLLRQALSSLFSMIPTI